MTNPDGITRIGVAVNLQLAREVNGEIRDSLTAAIDYPDDKEALRVRIEQGGDSMILTYAEWEILRNSIDAMLRGEMPCPTL